MRTQTLQTAHRTGLNESPFEKKLNLTSLELNQFTFVWTSNTFVNYLNPLPVTTYLSPSQSLNRQAYTLHSNCFNQLLWGNPKVFPSQTGDIISRMSPRSSPGFSCRKRMPKKPHQGGVQETFWSDAPTTPAGSSGQRVEVLLWATPKCPNSSPSLYDWAQPPYEGETFCPLVFLTLSFSVIIQRAWPGLGGRT